MYLYPHTSHLAKTFCEKKVISHATNLVCGLGVSAFSNIQVCHEIRETIWFDDKYNTDIGVFY